MTDTIPQLSPLRRRMIEDMTVRNLSPATQRSYLHAVTKFSRYFGRSPDRLDLEDVRAFHPFTLPPLRRSVKGIPIFSYSQGVARPMRPDFALLRPASTVRPDVGSRRDSRTVHPNVGSRRDSRTMRPDGVAVYRTISQGI